MKRKPTPKPEPITVSVTVTDEEMRRLQLDLQRAWIAVRAQIADASMCDVIAHRVWVAVQAAKETKP